MRRLKILHLASHNSIRAGGSIQMARLALDQKGRGHDVTCAFNIKKRDETPGLGTFGQLREAGITVPSFPMQRIAKLGGMLRFRRFLSANRFDVVHCHRFRALRFAHRASAGLRITALFGNKVNSYAVPARAAAYFGSPRVDGIFVNAEYLRSLLVETGRISADRIILIYNGVDLSVFNTGVDGSEFRRNHDIPAGSPLLGMIANFDRKKSHGVFFEAAERLLKKFPDARFVLAGGGDFEPYREELDRKGLGVSFLFAGFVREIEKLIAALDVSVIASKEGEGQTVSLVESMAMGKPVISTDVAGNPEFVSDRETGMLVPRGDAAALADAMVWLLENRAEALAMGERAHTFVKDKIDNRLVSERFVQAYYAVLRKRDSVAVR